MIDFRGRDFWFHDGKSKVHKVTIQESDIGSTLRSSSSTINCFPSEMPAAMNPDVEKNDNQNEKNPYLAAIYRKHRSIKKK